MGCGGKTKFVSTWKNPEAVPTTWQNEKVAAFARTFIKASRLGAEDALARELTGRGVQGIAGYTLVPEDVEKDQEKVKQLLEKAGIEGAIVMRVVDKSNEIYQTAGSAQYYQSFYGYWGSGWSGVYQPGHMTTETVVSIETLVYSVSQDKLLWAGMSSTTDPKDIPGFVKELVEVAGQEIKKAGLVSR